MTPSELLQRPVAFHPVFIRVTGSIHAAIMLSQINYWSIRMGDGWFYKTMTDWQEELFMTRNQIEVARRHLKKSGVVSEKRMGVPCRVHYRLNREQLDEKLLNLSSPETPQSSSPETPQTGSPETPQTRPPETQRTITETTQRLHRDYTEIDRSFDQFWSVWPKKVAKAEALKAWRQLKPDADTFRNILEDLRWRLDNNQWPDKQFIPNPATYLRGRRWEDERDNGFGWDESEGHGGNVPPTGRGIRQGMDGEFRPQVDADVVGGSPRLPGRPSVQGGERLDGDSGASPKLAATSRSA